MLRILCIFDDDDDDDGEEEELFLRLQELTFVLTILDYNLQWRYHQFTQYSTIANSHIVCISHSRQFTTHTDSSWSSVPHKSLGTNFQWRMFPFLGSRTALNRNFVQ
jgi:hypothetical protein